MRLATEEDSERILDFSYSQSNNLLGLFVSLAFTIWLFIYISENKLITISIIFAGSILILILFNLHVAEVRNSLKGKLEITYIIEHENIICGALKYLVFDRFVYVTGILVDINHRRKGIGSFMIQNCIDTVENPIYLSCLFEIKRFYKRLGFVDVMRSRVPSEISRFRSLTLHLMVFTQNRY